MGILAFLRARPRHRFATLALVALLAFSPLLTAEAPAAAVGTRFATLDAGRRHFENVEITAVSAQGIAFRHAGGLASAPFRELKPEVQVLFGWTPELEAAALANAPVRPAQIPHAKAVRPKRRSLSADSAEERSVDAVLARFGQTPEVRPEVSLRPRFAELALHTKDQGRRPSCAIFAIVSALEYQRAESSGTAEKLSEEYLLWATFRTTQRVSSHLLTGAAEAESPPSDAGFSLGEVVAALRGYGIPAQAKMPNTFGTRIDAIPEPAEEIQRDARTHGRAFVHLIPGRDPATRLANIVHALNAGIPVVIGLRWPHERTLRAGYLSEQKPVLNYAHAVTLVGYRAEKGQLDGTVFLFKNSYGPEWGEGGYGRATYDYLSKHLLDAVLLEVEARTG